MIHLDCNRSEVSSRHLAKRQSEDLETMVRKIGHRQLPPVVETPSGDALARAALLSEAAAALGTTGFPKGVYRYATHEAANRHQEECLAKAMASLAARRGVPPR